MRSSFYCHRSIDRYLCGMGLLCLLCLLAVPATRAQERGVLVLGDSISAAYGMSLEQGWVKQLADELSSRFPPHSVVNASISGETTAGGLRRLPDLLERHRPALVVIELGGNDGLRGYPIGKLRDNLREMVQLSQRAGARVLLLPMELPPNYGARYTHLFRESFPLVAEENGSALGPFLLEGVATDPRLMQADGIHPTEQAQPRLLDNVRASILELL
ncbi:MAG: arylesterase [Parahaliea sp.]